MTHIWANGDGPPLRMTAAWDKSHNKNRSQVQRSFSRAQAKSKLFVAITKSYFLPIHFIIRINVDEQGWMKHAQKAFTQRLFAVAALCLYFITSTSTRYVRAIGTVSNERLAPHKKVLCQILNIKVFNMERREKKHQYSHLFHTCQCIMLR